VVNEKGELLVVQEAIGPLKGKDIWKIPTGLVDAGEDLHIAAARECFEETGEVMRVTESYAGCQISNELRVMEC
jgi:8-oxo-dGTP pyrophosphatase MutT (NUDIX family)